MRHTTGDKGDIGVAKAIADLIVQGCDVLTPVASTAPFDLVIHDKGNFLKVQVKYREAVNGKIEVKLRRAVISDKHVRYRPMKRDECDVVCVYCPDTDRCYYVHMDDFKDVFTLRLSHALNGQTQGVRLACDYEKLGS